MRRNRKFIWNFLSLGTAVSVSQNFAESETVDVCDFERLKKLQLSEVPENGIKYVKSISVNELEDCSIWGRKKFADFYFAFGKEIRVFGFGK